MAWSASKMFRSTVADIMGNVAAFDFDADTFKAALYNNTITPDVNDTSAHNAYNASGGQWTTANEVTDVTNWVAGGRALATLSLDSTVAATVFFTAANLAGGGTLTLTNAYGCLVYDSTLATPVANQGACFNYFGGAQSVTAGTFTIAWSASGIWRISL